MKSQTCKRCGSQAEPSSPTARANTAEVVYVCSVCGRVYREESDTSQSLAEIRKAIEMVRYPASTLTQSPSSDRSVQVPSAVARELSLPSGRITKARKGPVMKRRSGHFQISLWKDRSFMAKSSNPRRAIRICVQHSIYDELTHDWRNQSIWCRAYELHDLLQAGEGLLEMAANDRGP